MNLWTVPKASLFPATLLGVLVLFAFATLQNYGPESTLRRFHVALKEISLSQANEKKIHMKDWNALQNTLQEDIKLPNVEGDPNAMALIHQVWSYYQSGATYSFARMDRVPGEVRIAVLYQTSGRPIPLVWVVDKPKGSSTWKISAQKTLSAMSVP